MRFLIVASLSVLATAAVVLLKVIQVIDTHNDRANRGEVER